MSVIVQVETLPSLISHLCQHLVSLDRNGSDPCKKSKIIIFRFRAAQTEFERRSNQNQIGIACYQILEGLAISKLVQICVDQPIFGTYSQNFLASAILGLKDYETLSYASIIKRLAELNSEITFRILDSDEIKTEIDIWDVRRVQAELNKRLTLDSSFHSKVNVVS